MLLRIYIILYTSILFGLPYNLCSIHYYPTCLKKLVKIYKLEIKNFNFLIVK